MFFGQLMKIPRKLRMPGATLATRLKVYDTPGPDGQTGGTPHMHLLCSEMYFVIGGSGAVEIIDARGFSIVELALHDVYVFSPGTLHRLINPRRDLELLIVMQNSGLPERGDAIVTMREEVMRSAESYAAAMRAQTFDDAWRRRDEGVRGFLEIKAEIERSPQAGREALLNFYKLAAQRTAARRAEWLRVVRDGPLAEAEHSLGAIEALNAGSIDFLLDSAQYFEKSVPYSAIGFCGHLQRYADPATLLLPEGEAKAA
jgi:mannose-6-phosphate isomerase-like protein (cupin superfamily)